VQLTRIAQLVLEVLFLERGDLNSLEFCALILACLGEVGESIDSWIVLTIGDFGGRGGVCSAKYFGEEEFGGVSAEQSCLVLLSAKAGTDLTLGGMGGG
jgi:hypothetical protein